MRANDGWTNELRRIESGPIVVSACLAVARSADGAVCGALEVPCLPTWALNGDENRYTCRLRDWGCFLLPSSLLGMMFPACAHAITALLSDNSAEHNTYNAPSLISSRFKILVSLKVSYK